MQVGAGTRAADLLQAADIQEVGTQVADKTGRLVGRPRNGSEITSVKPYPCDLARDAVALNRDAISSRWRWHREP